MSDRDDDSCSPSKKPRTEIYTTTTTNSSSSGSQLSSGGHSSGSASTSSLTPASIVEWSQPLSFFLTKVEGIDSKFNRSQALGIRGKIYYFSILIYNSYVNIIFC